MELKVLKSDKAEVKGDLSDDDLFNLGRLRLSQSFSDMIGVKKALLTVPVRKPTRQEFLRVRPGDEWCLQTAVLDLKEERETYLVDPDLWAEVQGEIIPKAIFTAMNRQGVLFLWPVKLPREDGRSDLWNTSAMEAAQMAKVRWVRVASNMCLQAYDVYVATSDLPEPEWPEISFEELLKIAFRDRFIRALDHPVLRRLRGEA